MHKLMQSMIGMVGKNNISPLNLIRLCLTSMVKACLWFKKESSKVINELHINNWIQTEWETYIYKFSSVGEENAWILWWVACYVVLIILIVDRILMETVLMYLLYIFSVCSLCMDFV